ncbi:multidrug transporter [Clostridium gelidum]|uniref:Multidrug transporter n=1 Tax=Clostridium gelidum TaxID=704125 RepID=A0ABN6IVW4_9CLOT|nr:TolC family protein [Clostridium gelidum]BCZ45065.1 multidrug transporter [Clostridium gelidum]
MRKNINKIVAFAIGISIMSGSIMPVFAADITQSNIAQSSVAQSNTTQKTLTQSTSTTNVKTNNIQTITNQKVLLTLEDAIKSAISISDTLALDDKTISYQNKTNDLKEKQDDSNNVSGDVEDFHNDTADIQLKKAQQKRDFDEDSLRKKVNDKYNDIVTSQIQINKAAKELEVKNKGFEDDETRESLGMKRLIDVKSTQLEVQKLQNEQKTNQNKLKDLEYSFKVLTGKDVNQYSLEQDIKFEPLKIDGSIDEYLDNSIDSYLKYTEQLVKLNKDYYDKDYEKDNGITTDDMDTAETAAKSATKLPMPVDTTDPDFATKYKAYTDSVDTYNNTVNKYTGILASRLTYLNTKLGNYQDETNLNKNKKDFKDQLKTLYTNLLTAEDNINYYKKNIEITNENLSNSKLKYDLGMITESAYNTEAIKSEQSDLDLRAEVINYNITKEKIQKPWIAFSN